MPSSNKSSPIHRKSGHSLREGHMPDFPSTNNTGIIGASDVDDDDYYYDGANNDQGIAADESKYGKRRHQKHKQKVKHTIALVLAALCLLTFTFWRVPAGTNNLPSSSSSSERDDDGDDEGSNGVSKQQRRLQEPQPRTKRGPRGVGGRGSPPDGGEADRRGDNDRRKKKKVQHQEFPHDDDADDDGSDDDGALGGDGDDDKVTNNIEIDPMRMVEMEEALERLEERVRSNTNHGIRWVEPGLIPPLKSGEEKPMLEVNGRMMETNRRNGKDFNNKFFFLTRVGKAKMAWEDEAKDIAKDTDVMRPTFVDYTKHKYHYPETLLEPPAHLGDYPKLTSMKVIMETWPQDDLDHPPETIYEDLIHFDYNNPEELKAAAKFRDAKLPFKMVNVPEVVAAGKKWTDEYLASNFGNRRHGRANGVHRRNSPTHHGSCQESPDNFFAFFTPSWSVEVMGLPPTRTNDFSFEKWAEHARYADRVGLDTNKPHFYFQCGIPADERYNDKKQWSFISLDLPSFSSPTETFFVFNPDEQKGIQCRFGERGVIAATHYDTGRNMVAMMTGAKRYILSPPRECSKLGIVTNHGSAIYRHSMLNFGHLNYMNHTDMPQEEREWMELAGTAGAISTVLKAGEVLYIPSHWFHYIVSVQKSAQCNVRSGVDEEGDAVFGGQDDVMDLCVANAALTA